ncbi:BhlA/UviB family holin-like peptide [Chengkuizengella sediminis]|uniref:BhlA/UviB family holin-like peptide n=1 Tax=Chengkuizengella sediminis TaxID=1885917 RepID=UPI001F0D0A86|nr:BhlA/UviB family holin-like peptide [Chengkuizengella sediminis]
MELNIIQYFLTQGPFAVLFVWLLIYVMKNNNNRENRLYNTLDELSKRFGSLDKKLNRIEDKIDRKEGE